MYITAIIFSALYLFLMHGGVFAGIAVIAFCIWIIFPIDFSTACIIAIGFSVFLMIFLVFIEPKMQEKNRKKLIDETMPAIRKAMQDTRINENIPYYVYAAQNKYYRIVFVFYDCEIPIYTRAYPNHYENIPIANITGISTEPYDGIRIYERNFSNQNYWDIRFLENAEGRQQKMQAYRAIKRICKI